MTYTEVQQALKPYKEKGLTTIKLNSAKADLEAELLRLESAPVSGEVSADELVKISQLEDEQVAEAETETPQPTDTKEVERVVKIIDANFELPTQATYPDCATNLKGNYRIDSTDAEDELWLENLDENGLPTEDYILVDDAELIRLKANGQIWKHDSKLERWVPPYIPPNYQSTDDVQLTADDVDAEIEIFLSDVTQKKLSDEQLEAIAIALNDANNRSVTASEALAQIGQFRLFTPHQLLAWGFDHIIPRSGMLARFRDAITKSKRRAIVCIKFSPDPENAALLTAWAASYKGGIYCRILKDGYQHEEWGFLSLEYAEQFCEYCSKLSFVQSATIETNVLGVEISEKKLVEVA